MGSIKRSTARITSASGSVTDRRYEFAEIGKHEDVDFIAGDWMSDYNMTTRGAAKVSRSSAETSEYKHCFLEYITSALESLNARGIRVTVNAGASDTSRLHYVPVDVIAAKGLSLKAV